MLCAAGHLSAAEQLSGPTFKAWRNALNWLQTRQHVLLVGDSLESNRTIAGDSTVKDAQRNTTQTQNKRLKATG
jgi:hypothetical protein